MGIKRKIVIKQNKTIAIVSDDITEKIALIQKDYADESIRNYIYLSRDEIINLADELKEDIK